MTVRIAIAMLGLVGAVTGCDLEPDVGPAYNHRCSDKDSDPSRAVSFSRDIVPLVTREVGGCTRCHLPDADEPVGVILGGLNVTSYSTLRSGGARSATTIIIPGRPCDSIMYQKITVGPPFGERMPADGPPFWTGLETDLVHDWIAEGALDN